MSERIPVWIDTDGGADDAAALLCACKLEKLEILGVSVVAGNLSRDGAFERTRDVLALAGRADVPVYPGAEKPLLRSLPGKPRGHGGAAAGSLTPSPAKRETRPAWDALYEAAMARPGTLEVVAIGPQTNLSIALNIYPRLRRLLRRIVMMGGAVVGGNITPAAEFNVFADPQSAQAVFRSGVPVVMCGLDVTLSAYLTLEETAEIGGRETPTGVFFRDITTPLPRFRGEGAAPGVCLHDLCPVLYLAYPDLFTGREAGVYVETQGTITQGKTVTDLWSDRPFPIKNTFVVLDVDREGFAAQVTALLSGK